ncbi:hypothetical protein F4775DRAFT_592005 [Biscogniauxia sp. FL1348]|nr:hypothetical protein F4775DRAFT_592005 [Biscogniauxia sp. FL1348]
MTSTLDGVKPEPQEAQAPTTQPEEGSGLDGPREMTCELALLDKRYDSDGHRPLKQLLQDVVVDFPNEPINSQLDVELDLPAYCLFLYRKELETIGMERFKDGPQELGHLKLLLDWIDRELEDAFKAFQRFSSSDMRPISYVHLWTVFRPGSIIYTHILGQPRAFRMRGFRYEDDKEPCLAVTGQFVDYDGHKFGAHEGRNAPGAFDDIIKGKG